MFRFFGNRNKMQAKYSLEEQIITLKQLGFTFNVYDEQLIHSLLNHFERDVYEDDPYSLLLTICGAELSDKEDKELRLSNEILNFDTECVEDERIYDYLVDQFTQLSNGKFVLANVKSLVDFDNEIAKITFEYEGSIYDWEIAFNHDWIDFNLLRKLGNLAYLNKDSKHYYCFNDGQHLTLIYCDRATVKKLNRLMKNIFVLLT